MKTYHHKLGNVEILTRAHLRITPKCGDICVIDNKTQKFIPGLIMAADSEQKWYVENINKAPYTDYTFHSNQDFTIYRKLNS
jgi:hypothetical protein